MLSPLHQSLLELAHSGSLICELLRGQVELPEGELVVQPLPADFTQLPAEYRADHVVALRARGRGSEAPPDLVVVLEVQLAIDGRKRWTWPVYVASAAAKHRCHAVLLVLAPEQGVARWARELFASALGLTLHPIVISYADVPEHLDEELTRRSPELAVLTVLAHPTMEIGRAVLHLLRRAPPEREMLYLDMVMKALVDVHGSAAEELMENSGYEFQSSFFRRKLEQCIEQGMAQGIEQGIERGIEQGIERGIEQGIERGIEQGIERGIAQGERKGRLAALQQVAFELAAGKLGSRPAALASSIDEIDDASVLTSLVVALGQAHGAEEVRAAVAQARQAPALSTPG